MRLRRGNRGASSRMTSSVYRPLSTSGFACRGGRFSVPCEVIRSGGDGRCASIRAPRSSRTASGNRSAGGPNARRATICSVTRNEPIREDSVHAVVPRTPPRIGSRATLRARNARAAQRESDHAAGASDDPRSPPRGLRDRHSVKWAGTRSVAKCEARADAPTPRRARDAKRCET